MRGNQNEPMNLYQNKQNIPTDVDKGKSCGTNESTPKQLKQTP